MKQIKKFHYLLSWRSELVWVLGEGTASAVWNAQKKLHINKGGKVEET